MEYLFVLGRTIDLCRAELEAVLKSREINYETIFASSQILHLKTPQVLDTNQLIKTLGGTIKIGEVAGEMADRPDGHRDLVKMVKMGEMGKEKKSMDFGLSGYGGIQSNDLNHWSRQIKEKLQEQGRSSRFVLANEGTTISSVVVRKQKITEILLVKEKLEDGERIIVGKTLAVQDFTEWGKRDFGRPESDPHSGMLPPKVARMMVNLGSWNLETGSLTLLDPFCGMGTILTEGMMRGYEVIGSDISQEAIRKSGKNLEWFKKNSQLSISNYQLFNVDATHLSEKITANSVDAIVTEPYLGPNEFSIFNDQFSKIQNIITGLEKLYIGCLREWRKILKPGAMVVIIFPSFKSPASAKASAGKEYFVKRPLDTCGGLGYTLVAGPYQYFRPQAVVRRNIYIFKSKVRSQNSKIQVKN